MKYRAIVVALVTFVATFSFAAPSAEAVGPWTKSFGEYYVKVGSNYYRASAYREPSGNLNEDAPYTNFTNYVFGQVGLWDNLHLQFYVPVEYARLDHQETDPGTSFGLGDTLVSIQASPLDLGIPTSIRLEAKLPFYEFDLTPPLAPAPGDHQVDYTAWLSAGGGLHARDIPLYYSADIGYKLRTRTTFSSMLNEGQDLSDAFVSYAQVGYTVAETVDIGLGASATLPFDRDINDESYVTVGPSVYWPVTDWMALELDGYFTPYARNSGDGWAIGTGVSFSRDQY